MPVAPLPLAADLRRFGDRPALVGEGGCLTYAALAARVDEVADELGTARRLVLLEAANRTEVVVAYLACLAAGHPVLLAPGGAVDGLLAAYDPDVVVRGADAWAVRERRSGSVHRLHDELALLMSTSGSTGSPKLVRLSAHGLQANAEAVATSLGLREDDVAATTLPLGYCYGLSVLNSHLVRGAAVLLTDLSVVDPCFWVQFQQYGATSLAGVPHTFDLLDRSGFADRELPSLRRVTQAGGRLAPEHVRRYAALGRQRGWDLHVMYGQTEATARLACLPPELAATRPTSIGRAIPGGTLSLADVDAAGVGELVYAGPNVMLGYACDAGDLARGRTVTALRTGDLARLCDDGLYEVVGRSSRIAKVFGLRIDLDRVEQQLQAGGLEVACAAQDDELVVAACTTADQAGVAARRVAAAAGLPARAVRLVPVRELPRLPSGKRDLQAVRRLAPPRPAAPVPAGADAAALCALLAEVLERPVTPHDTFVGLGGDSLSYVEVSHRLEEALGDLPEGWHLTPLRELAREQPPTPRRGRALETGVLLRAVAILLVVGSHTELWTLLGGAHVLLAVAGYNFARFHVTASATSRRALRSVGRVVVPSVAFLAVAAAATERYALTNVLLLNGALGPDRWGPTWHYWFLEVLVWTLLGCIALLAVPAVRAVEQHRPWGFALALLAAGIASRYAPQWLPTGPDRIHTAHVVFWLFALGWAATRADTTARRLLLSAVVLATLPGFFDDPRREAVVAAALLALLWIRTVRVPVPLAAAARAVAAASLHVYVTHWLVYPPVEERTALGATALSVGVGLAYHRLDLRAQALWRTRVRPAVQVPRQERPRVQAVAPPR